MRATILSVGSELLRGDIVDTNAAFLTRACSQLGFEVDRVVQMGDRLDDLTNLVRFAGEHFGLVLITGGLGPTEDDLTRQAIAGALNEPLYEDEALIDAIAERFRGMGRPMTRNNRQQGLLIPSATAIPNPNGTAPGWYVERDGKVIVAMPGPPREMHPMWRDWVLPRMERLLPGAVAMRGLMTFGVGESMLEERIRDILHRHEGVIVATYAKTYGVQIHITARGTSAEESQSLLDTTVREIEERVGDAIFGAGDTTLSAVVGEMVRAGGRSLAVMESCTGGEIASLLTNVTGSSEYFMGGVVAYSPEVKARHGVEREIMDQHGVISAETARAMARAVRESFGTEIGVSSTGIAGSEPVEDNPPGTVFVAVSLDDREDVQEIHRPGRRETVKGFAAQCALDLLRRTLLGVNTP